MKRTREQLLAIAVLISQAINVILFDGNPDMTLSARCHINRNQPGWRSLRKLINRLFFWQADHCAASFASDVEYANQIMEILDQDEFAKEHIEV